MYFVNYCTQHIFILFENVIWIDIFTHFCCCWMRLQCTLNCVWLKYSDCLLKGKKLCVVCSTVYTATCVESWVQYAHTYESTSNANDTTCVSFIYDRQTMFKMFKESIHTMMGSKRSIHTHTSTSYAHTHSYHISSLLLVLEVIFKKNME